MRDCRKIEVWGLAHRFVLDIYRLTNGFPRHEIYGLTSQIRRAAVSIPANISEGAVKKSKRDYIRFLDIAYSSAAEVAYFLILSRDLEYISAQQYIQLESARILIACKLYRLMEFMTNELEKKS